MIKESIIDNINKQMERVKYLEKYTLDREVKKYTLSAFKKATYRCENRRASGHPWGSRWGTTLKFQIGKYVLLHIFEKVFLR